MNFETALLLLPGLVIGLTVHEAAHAISAKWLGDRTSEKMGRISLNPMRHLSIYGTLALFFLGFGWGKPVIVNLYNFKKPKFYYLLSSLAGPVSNLIICGICLAVLYMRPPQKVGVFLEWVYFINGILAAINLVPVPPLDGSKIWPCLIPGMKPTISGKWSMIWIVVLIIALQTGGIGKVLRPIQNGMWELLPSDSNSPVIEPKIDRPKDFPEVLVGPKGAEGIFYDISSPNVPVMSFSVNETMEGIESYHEIEERLKKFGWHKLKYEYLEPETVHVSGWKKVAQPNNELSLYNSVDTWVASDDRMIMVCRYYKSFDDKSLDDIYGFIVNYFKNGDGNKAPLNDYKKLHPEEFEGIEISE